VCLRHVPQAIEGDEGALGTHNPAIGGRDDVSDEGDDVSERENDRSAGEERTRGEEVDHVVRNRAAWSEWATEYVAPGERAWASTEPSWGIWSIPEVDLHVLPDDLDGKDTIELGSRSSTVSLSRSSRATPNVSRSPMRASIWRSPSTAPASGPIRTCGSPRLPAYCAPAGSSSSSRTGRS